MKKVLLILLIAICSSASLVGGCNCTGFDVCDSAVTTNDCSSWCQTAGYHQGGTPC